MMWLARRVTLRLKPTDATGVSADLPGRLAPDPAALAPATRGTKAGFFELCKGAIFRCIGKAQQAREIFAHRIYLRWRVNAHFLPRIEQKPRYQERRTQPPRSRPGRPGRPGAPPGASVSARSPGASVSSWHPHARGSTRARVTRRPPGSFLTAFG